MNPSNTDITDQINDELSKVLKWLAANRLSLNIKKTKFMIFRNPAKRITDSPDIKVHGEKIEQVKTFNLFGINIDENLKWRHHLDQISIKLSRCIGISHKLKHYVPFCTLKTMYFSLFMSHITYGILVWGNHAPRIVQLQKKVIRIITNSRYNAHTSPLFKSLNCLKFEDLYKLNVLKFYFKYCHNELPGYFRSFDISTRSMIHTYNIRSKELLHVPKTRTRMAEKCLRIVIPNIVNASPINILNKIFSHSYSGLIWNIKQVTIDGYSCECQLENCYVCRFNN